MIPILYSANETNFDTNGVGRLSDCISCVVTEERNGEYTLMMEYPITGIHFEDIEHSSILKVLPSVGANYQLFRIYKISTPLNGKVEIEADHISYQLSFIPVEPFEASTCSEALNGLKSYSMENNPFSVWTDITTSANYTQSLPASFRSRLGGVQGSILDVYGGEYEFDNYTVKLHSTRGSNNGVALRYGKNIIDIKQEQNIENTITGICPYYQSGDTIVTLSEGIISASTASDFPFNRSVTMDFSSEFSDVPTEAELRAYTQSYITRNSIGIPNVSISVDFINLAQTEEYKDIANLETVKLCDTVTVIFEKLNISATAKVVKTEFDVLKEKYNTIEIGSVKTDLANKIVTIAGTTEQIKKIAQSAVTSEAMKEAIDEATELITGGAGGYLVINTNDEGQPNELLLMDQPDRDDATYVLRINYQGIGFSSSGYNGPFTTAWTIDGAFNANYITTGTLKIGGTASSPASITIENTSGTTIGSWDTDGIYVASGSLKLGKTSLSDANAGVYVGSDGIALGANSPFKVTSAGALTATGATITGNITVGGSNNTNGSITVTNASNSNIGTWNNAGLSISSGTFKLGGKTSLSDANAGVYVGSDGIALGANSPFKVTNAGVLTATSATITGTISGSTISGSKMEWDYDSDNKAYITMQSVLSDLKTLELYSPSNVTIKAASNGYGNVSIVGSLSVAHNTTIGGTLTMSDANSGTNVCGAQASGLSIGVFSSDGYNYLAVYQNGNAIGSTLLA